MDEILIKKVNYDRNVYQFHKSEINTIKKNKHKNFDLEFSGGIKTTKKELLLNVEIKLHKELFGKYIKGIGNRKLCKIKDKWVNLRDVKNIIPKNFIIYDITKDRVIKISNLEKTNYLLIASFEFRFLCKRNHLV